MTNRCHQPYWEYANKTRLLVLAHTWGESAFNGSDKVEKILSLYPDLVFVAGHSLHGSWDIAVHLAAFCPNLHLELTAGLDDRGGLDLFIDKLGSEKILTGLIIMLLSKPTVKHDGREIINFDRGWDKVPATAEDR